MALQQLQKFGWPAGRNAYSINTQPNTIPVYIYIYQMTSQLSILPSHLIFFPATQQCAQHRELTFELGFPQYTTPLTCYLQLLYNCYLRYVVCFNNHSLHTIMSVTCELQTAPAPPPLFPHKYSKAPPMQNKGKCLATKERISGKTGIFFV